MQFFKIRQKNFHLWCEIPFWTFFTFFKILQFLAMLQLRKWVNDELKFSSGLCNIFPPTFFCRKIRTCNNAKFWNYSFAILFVPVKLLPEFWTWSELFIFRASFSFFHAVICFHFLNPGENIGNFLKIIKTWKLSECFKILTCRFRLFSKDGCGKWECYFSELSLSRCNFLH